MSDLRQYVRSLTGRACLASQTARNDAERDYWVRFVDGVGRDFVALWGAPS